MILFVWSVSWDLHVPQEEATFLFEDNDGCTAMGTNGSNVILCYWNILIHLSKCRTIWQRAYRQHSSINTLTLFLVTSHQCILRSAVPSLECIPIILWKLTILFCLPSLPPLPRQLLAFMLPSCLITSTTLGCTSLGMDSSIHYFLYLHTLFVHALHCIVDCGEVT